MRKTENFKILDREFEITSLDPLTSLKTLKHVSAVLGPIFSAAASSATPDGPDVALKNAIEGLDELPALAAVFRKACKVDWATSEGGAAKRVPLDAFFDLVFVGEPASLIAWLVACVKFEYSDFLVGSGPALLAGMANDLTSLTGSLGKSGESSSTKGSQ